MMHVEKALEISVQRCSRRQDLKGNERETKEVNLPCCPC